MRGIYFMKYICKHSYISIGLIICASHFYLRIFLAFMGVHVGILADLSPNIDPSEANMSQYKLIFLGINP